MSMLDNEIIVKRYRWKKTPWYKPDELEIYEEVSSLRNELSNNNGAWISPSHVSAALFILVDEIEDLKNKLDKLA